MKIEHVKFLGAYTLGLFLFAFLTPDRLMLSSYKIPASDIFIVGDNLPIVPNRFVAHDADRRLRQQYRPRQKNFRRFHVKFDENWPIAGPRSLYIPSIGAEARIFINGTAHGTSEILPVFAPGLGQDWLRKDIPRWIMLPGQNRLDIHVQSDVSRAGLRGVYVVPGEIMNKIEHRHLVWQRAVPIGAVLGGILVIFIVIAGLMYGRRKHTYLLIGCLAGLVLCQGGLAFTGMRPPFNMFEPSLRFVFPALMLCSLFALYVSDRDTWPVFNDIKHALFALAVTGPVAGLIVITLPVTLPSSLYFATLALLGVLPLLIWRGGWKLREDLAAHRSRLEELKATVSAQAEELDERGQIIAREMQQRAILEERQRFTRDIHDGIGGQLLSLLLRVRTGTLEQEQIEDEIQTGLNDLRLVVDSMDHTGDDLKVALATFRARARNQMSAAGIHLEWEQSDDIDMRFPTSGGTLHLYRFMQEALTNVVRHAQASHVTVLARQASPEAPLYIKIEDDGIGFDYDETQVGKGLGNLRSRAKSLGGKLQFITGPDGTGTTIDLMIPHAV